MTSAQDPREPLSVVDEQDRPQGVRPRWLIHRDGLPHRAVHVLVFDGQGRLYLQRRSPAKDTFPGRWTSSASGHVDPGEDYGQAARRELMEELGLEAPLIWLGKIAAQPATGMEFSAVYRAQTAQAPQPNPREIIEGRFFTPAQAQALAQDSQKAVPGLKLVLALALGSAG
ncbi:MAG: NUDIX domain-containing protein [Desulfarculus sp.]|nr:NUDIX domain-containing protein [Desulfarculus sp.]